MFKMRLFTLLFSMLISVLYAQDKVGVTSVISNEADRNFGKGHAGNNAAYIQQLRNVVLPVSLMSFELKVADNYIKVEWKTANEKNSSHFILKRAGDDKVFKAIAEIKAVKESSSTTHYQYFDRFPLIGQNYYKLEQVDADGIRTLSDIITTAYHLKNQKMFAYFSDRGFLNTVVDIPKQEGFVEITVFNLNGQIVAFKKVNIAEDIHYQFNDLILNKGLYLISFAFEGQIITQKIIK